MAKLIVEIDEQGNTSLDVVGAEGTSCQDLTKAFARMGFQIAATGGTAARLREHGVAVETILKVSEGRPNVVDHIKNGDIQLVINVSLGRRSSEDAYHIRRGALLYNVLYTTTISGARATAEAIDALRKEPWDVAPLQAYHGVK